MDKYGEGPSRQLRSSRGHSSRGQPSRGRPSRGRPSRGRPSRGSQPSPFTRSRGPSSETEMGSNDSKQLRPDKASKTALSFSPKVYSTLNRDDNNSNNIESYSDLSDDDINQIYEAHVVRLKKSSRSRRSLRSSSASSVNSRSHQASSVLGAPRRSISNPTEKTRNKKLGHANESQRRFRRSSSAPSEGSRSDIGPSVSGTVRRSISNPTKKSKNKKLVEASGSHRASSPACEPGPSRIIQSAPVENIRNRKQANPRNNEHMILLDIRKYQTSTRKLIPKLPFSRIIKDLLQKYSLPNRVLHVTPEALQALQESAEMYIVQLFEDSYLCAVHRNRVTLVPKDIQLVLFLRNK